MTKKIKKIVESDFGWRVEITTEDSDTPMEGHWYGTREECEEINPDEVILYPVRGGVDPFDLACERRWD